MHVKNYNLFASKIIDDLFLFFKYFKENHKLFIQTFVSDFFTLCRIATNNNRTLNLWLN
jgi:hypothetical protein